MMLIYVIFDKLNNGFEIIEMILFSVDGTHR